MADVLPSPEFVRVFNERAPQGYRLDPNLPLQQQMAGRSGDWFSQNNGELDIWDVLINSPQHRSAIRNLIIGKCPVFFSLTDVYMALVQRAGHEMVRGGPVAKQADAKAKKAMALLAALWNPDSGVDTPLDRPLRAPR